LLLPTITSRCQWVKFDPLATDDIETALIQRTGLEKKRARLTARLAGGSYRRALELIDEDLQEMQTRALEFFRKCVQNEHQQLQFIEELLVELQRDPKKIKDLLNLASFWFRDAMLFTETGGKNHDLLINFDQEEVLQNFAASFPKADLFSAVGEIERALELMERNVQLHLILLVLLNQLRTYLRR
jgi:DNA polymerase-3 subunit delta'